MSLCYCMQRAFPPFWLGCAADTNNRCSSFVLGTGLPSSTIAAHAGLLSSSALLLVKLGCEDVILVRYAPYAPLFLTYSSQDGSSGVSWGVPSTANAFNVLPAVTHCSASKSATSAAPTTYMRVHFPSGGSLCPSRLSSCMTHGNSRLRVHVCVPPFSFVCIYWPDSLAVSDSPWPAASQIYFVMV